MDDSGEWFRYHPLFGSFLRQRCQWELAVELPEIHRAAAESWMAQGFPSEAIHHALAAGDAKMLRDILLNHAWGMFNHSELGLLEQSLAASPKSSWGKRSARSCRLTRCTSPTSTAYGWSLSATTATSAKTRHEVSCGWA